MAGDESQKFNEEHDPDLDTLLDDALEDFNKPTPSITQNVSSQQRSSPSGDEVITEDFIKQATENFEAKMRALMVQQQKVAAASAAAQYQQNAGSSRDITGQPADVVQFDVQSLTEEFTKFAKTASRVAAASASTPDGSAVSTDHSAAEVPDFQKLLADTVQQMTQNSQNYQAAPSPDDLSKLLEGLSVSGAGAESGEAAGLFPLMQSMLENILSKEILYPPIKDIVMKYPDWLADNRATTKPSEFDRYSRQYDVMKKVVELFESEKESDSDETKSKRFEDLVILMQKLQEEGHPPTELAGDADAVGNLLNFDPTNPGAASGALPDFGALLSGAATGGSGGTAASVGEEQCCVM